MPSIRLATKNDIKAMQTIVRPFEPSWTQQVFQDCFKSHYQNWVLVLDQQVIGFIIISCINDQWEIMQIAINQIHQRQGFAALLLECAFTKATLAEVEKIHLEVRSSNNAAIALYKKLGFEMVGLRKHYYRNHEDALLFNKTLYNTPT